jgi:TRAP-type C4-dicarboxylate transport system substrate-binding protein
VEKDAGGTLKFQEFWGGQLSRSPAKQYELMINGIQDATTVLPSYTQELFPDFSLFSLPYLFQNAAEGSRAMWRMYEKGLVGGLDKVYVVALYNNGNSLLHFSKSIDSGEEIKGLKIRAAGPDEAAVVKAVGGVPVGMAITQVAESLNRGVIDGALSGWNAAQSFRFLPLIKTHYEEPLGVRTFFLGINKKVYDGLPEKAKQAIQKNTGLEISRRMGDVVYDQDNDRLRKKASADPKRKIITILGAEMGKRFNQIFKPFHEDWIKSTPDGQKKYDALMNILADIRKGQ